MTTTYIHKLNLGVNMAYNMRHALTDSHRSGKIWPCSWKKMPFVLEFCKILLENMNYSLKNIQLVLSDLWDALKKLCENRKKKLKENH